MPVVYEHIADPRSLFQDVAPILPLFSNIHTLRLPLQSRHSDATESCTAIAECLPFLQTISWMECVAFQGVVDEYVVKRDNRSVTVSRVGPTIPAQQATVAPAGGVRPRSRGFSLFDTLNSFVSPTKPSLISDAAVSLTALMVVSSMVFTPILALFGY